LFCLRRGWTSCFKAEHNVQLTKNPYFFKFAVKEKHVVFGNNEEEREKNTSAALCGDNSKGSDKEEFKKVFCDKKEIFSRDSR